MSPREVMFWTPKVVTRVELYGHWRGKEIAEKLKRETAAHQELDRLREAMIFGEAEGDAYLQTKIILQKSGYWIYLII